MNTPLSYGKTPRPDGIPLELFKIALNGDPALRQVIWGETATEYVTIRVLHKIDGTYCGECRGMSLVAYAGYYC